MSKYRYICLLNHSYKLLSVYLLRKLNEEVEFNLPSCQFGFRANKGTRDAIYLLSTFIDECIESGSETYATFIDFTAAFDSVSHKFLDYSLEKMGASVQSRALFRTIYENAKGQIRVRNANGSYTFSRSFLINRGVVQGDIFSPYGFIIALAILVAEYDPLDYTEAGRLNCLSETYHYVNSILYADDSAMISRNIEKLSKRLTHFEEMCAKHADMEISRPKTFAMTIRRQIKVPHTTPEEYQTFAENGLLKIKCDWCCTYFHSTNALKVHQDLHCRKAAEKHLYCPDLSSPPEFQKVLKIVDTRGHGNAKDRLYLVYWEEEDSETHKLFDINPKKIKCLELDEIEYIAAEDPDDETYLVKWNEYPLDGAIGDEDN